MQHLYHVSEEPNIEVFEPRAPPTESSSVQSPVVWAVDQSHLPNYLVPRECPRVAFQLLASSTTEDEERLLGSGGARHVVAIESAWFERAVGITMWVYEFSPEPFACIDATAGYFVSAVAVSPVLRRCVKSPLAELLSMGTELRVVPSLHALAAEVASSSLAFSCIRMRNAGASPNAL
jgi:hypothetical protein